MKHRLGKIVLFTLIAPLCLTGCNILSMFSFGGSDNSGGVDHPYSGHYLFEMYRPTQDQNTGVKYAHNENTIVIDNEDRYEAFLFNTNVEGGDLLNSRNDVSVTFNIDQGKFKSLCFLAGCAEDYLTQYRLDDSCAFSIWNGTTKLYEEMYYALGPSKYVSIDISNADSLTFYISKQFRMRCLGVAEVSLWEDAKHSIAPTVQKATAEEDFIDHSYFVYGAGTNGANSLSSIDDGGFFKVLSDSETATVNNEVIKKGVAFTTKSWFSEEDCQKFAMNALGRYKYLHFNLGHADKSQSDGSVYVRVSVDRTVKVLELIHDTDLPHEVTIDLNYGKIVTFEVYPDPQDKTRTDLFSYGSYVVYNFVGSPNKTFPSNGNQANYDGSYKLISQIGLPYSFTNNFNRDSSILTGKTAYAGVQMCGVLYTEGLIMKSIFNMMTTTVEQIPATASFDIKRAFKYVTFKVGRKDKTALANDTLNVYVDGELKNTYQLNSMGCVTEYTVECNKGRTLTFELVGTSDTYRGTYGIVDIGVHTSKVGELNFDHTPNGKKAAADSYTKNQKVTLMKDILPYESFSAKNEQDIFTEDRSDTAEYTTDDGRYFTVNGKNYNEGVILQTGTYMSLGGGAAAGALTCMFLGFVLLVPLGMQEVDCSSVAAFNLRNKFSSISFKVAPLENNSTTEQLSLVTPNGLIKEVNLANQEVTVNVELNNVNELAFFLKYGSSGSVPFALYDMVLTAK